MIHFCTKIPRLHTSFCLKVSIMGKRWNKRNVLRILSYLVYFCREPYSIRLRSNELVEYTIGYRVIGACR